MSTEAIIGIVGAALTLIGIVITVLLAWRSIEIPAIKVSAIALIVMGAGLLLVAAGILASSILSSTAGVISETTYEVFANLSWQDTGVQLAHDDRLRIIWDGVSRWRGTNYGDFSDPLGGWIDTTNPPYVCPPLMDPEEAGWNALVARIGENGTPFAPFKQILTGEGTLYLAMNDCDSQRFDNEGSIIVTIEVSR
jgi:hypothetical protein